MRSNLMNKQPTFNIFPYGAPTGSIHPYNTLADAIGPDQPRPPLWQQSHGVSPLDGLRTWFRKVLETLREQPPLKVGGAPRVSIDEA